MYNVQTALDQRVLVHENAEVNIDGRRQIRHRPENTLGMFWGSTPITRLPETAAIPEMTSKYIADAASNGLEGDPVLIAATAVMGRTIVFPVILMLLAKDTAIPGPCNQAGLAYNLQNVYVAFWSICGDQNNDMVLVLRSSFRNS